MGGSLSMSQELELLRVLDLYERRGRVGGTPMDVAAAVATLTPWTAQRLSEMLAARGCISISACQQRLLCLTETGRGLARGMNAPTVPASRSISA